MIWPHFEANDGSGLAVVERCEKVLTIRSGCG